MRADTVQFHVYETFSIQYLLKAKAFKICTVRCKIGTTEFWWPDVSYTKMLYTFLPAKLYSSKTKQADPYLSHRPSTHELQIAIPELHQTSKLRWSSGMILAQGFNPEYICERSRVQTTDGAQFFSFFLQIGIELLFTLCTMWLWPGR